MGKLKKKKIYSKINKNGMYSFLNPFLPILTMETMIYHGHHTVSSLRFRFLRSFTFTFFLLPFLQEQLRKCNRQVNNITKREKWYSYCKTKKKSISFKGKKKKKKKKKKS